MLVRAIALGLYGDRRRKPGDVFTLKPVKRKRMDKDGVMKEITISEERQFSKTWMERVEEPKSKGKIEEKSDGI